MLQFIVQGRGGQGAQMAGEILAHAFFRAGKHVQAYATYGGARRGTPVSSFIRVDEQPIRLRCNIEKPDVIVCFDPSLLNNTLLQGATSDTLVLINSAQPPEHFRELGNYKLATIDAKAISQANNLGRIVNSTLVGAVVGLLDQPGIEILR
ncbi:MAG TPA: 2-oxoacid:acceptor oxidoreductase family protein, partial [Verrucomicrobiae bacterium]|nr:2-oxoacid:acceptor oxidoreductase family protein [Verrucomicrobiae bacterium]